jgi:dTDP-4-amino-4,6-dideoxygalactose transaminase
MSSKYQYNSWPLGKVPKELQRPELDQIRERGYQWEDPRDVIDIFEKKVAAFAGSRYAVSVDCCTHAMELSLRLLLENQEVPRGATITIPSHTYISAALMPLQLGFQVEFEDLAWSGIYQLKGTRVYDGAVRWRKGMYVGANALQALSFQIKKRIPIGRGGMILCDRQADFEWLKLASYDGRDLTLPYTDKNHLKLFGYHYYMTPEDAARGIILMDAVGAEGGDGADSASSTTYPDVQQMMENATRPSPV